MKPQLHYKVWAVLCAVAAIIGLVITGVLAVRSVNTQGKAALDITNRICVPILLYHHISTDESLLGEFCITPAEFENDLIYLKENGYTPIHISELVEYCYSNASLPIRPIVISFDGGFSSGYTHAFSLLQKYNVKAVFSIVGEKVNEASALPKGAQPAYLRWNELREMTESSLVELSNQSYNMNLYIKDARRGTARQKEEALDAYVQALYNDVLLLQQETDDKVGVVPVAFTYPYGIIGKETVNLISEMGFAATLSRDEGANYLSQNPQDLYRLRRTVRSHGAYIGDLLYSIYRTKAVYSNADFWVDDE